MDDAYYSTGQAARELGVTQAKVRALCESEAIESTSTPGGQYRIHRDELARLKQEGLPPVPRPLPNGDRHRNNAPPALRPSPHEETLLAEPSEAAIGAADEVVQLENEVRAIGLRQQKEVGLDWFRERKERDAARRTEHREAERVERANAEAARHRKFWMNKWTQHGLRLIPIDAPQSLQIDVHRAVEEALKVQSPEQSDFTTGRIVSAAVERALTPWRQQKRITDAIESACNSFSVPWDMKRNSGWKARMLTAAGTAIEALRKGAGDAEMRAAAENAVTPIVLEFEYLRLRSEIVEGTWFELRDATSAEKEEGKEAVKEAVARLPHGASKRELEQAREKAIAPIRARIAQRQDQEMRKRLVQRFEFRLIGWPDGIQKDAMAAFRELLDQQPNGTPATKFESIMDHVSERFKRVRERQQRKVSLIDYGVRQIKPYLDKLANDWEFDKSTYALAGELQAPVRSALQQALLGDEPEDQVASLVRRKLRDELDIS